jgi:hypothetical protein
MANTNGGRRTKVARIIDEYELTGMGARLEAAWTGESGNRQSLRDLADEFNEAVVESSLRDVESTPLEFEVSGTYHALSDESNADATRARRRLEREGVDVDELESNFVTHQAIHTYLKRDRDATLPEKIVIPGNERSNRSKSSRVVSPLSQSRRCHRSPRLVNSIETSTRCSWTCARFVRTAVPVSQ